MNLSADGKQCLNCLSHLRGQVQPVLVALTFLFDRDAHRQTRLMHVDSTTARVNNFHIASLPALWKTLKDRNLSCVLQLTCNGKLLRQFVVQISVWTKLLFGL